MKAKCDPSTTGRTEANKVLGLEARKREE